MCAAHTSNDSYPCVSLPDPQRKHFQHGPVLMSVASRCRRLNQNPRPAWQEWSLRRSDCGAVIHLHKRQAKGNACPGRAYSCGSAPRLDRVLPWFPRQHLDRKRHICPKRPSLKYQHEHTSRAVYECVCSFLLLGLVTSSTVK